MNKRELIEQLEKYPDNAEIVLWEFSKNGSSFELLNPVVSNNRMDDDNNPVHPNYFAMAHSQIFIK